MTQEYIEKTEHWIIDYRKTSLCVECDLPYPKGMAHCPRCGGRLKTEK